MDNIKIRNKIEKINKLFNNLAPDLLLLDIDYDYEQILNQLMDLGFDTNMMENEIENKNIELNIKWNF
jgi:hypothetical protein